MKRIFIVAALLATIGCGLEKNSKKNQLREKEFHPTNEQGEQVVDGYGYELSGDSCTTGFHGPMSLKDFCSELLDDAKNASCAKDARAATHARDCETK